MPDEANEFPTILILPGVVRTKRGHTRKPHAIVDDVVKLAVAEILRVSLPHIRGLRIQTLSDESVPASIITVANRAMIREVRHGIRKHFRAGGYRVRHLTRSARHCNVTQLASKKCLSRIRFVARAEAAPHDVDGCYG